MNSLRKVALITGAGRNTGRGIALRLAKEGANIVLVDKDAAQLNETADQITATGRRVSVYLTDITGREQLRDAVDHAEKTFGTLDIMVNNPCFERKDADAAIGYEEVEQLINHSIHSTCWGIQVAADTFRQRRRKGTIVNVWSSAGHESASWVDIHTASKMALRALTQAASRELAPDGIMVTLQCFGTIIPAARYVS
ncbi:MULTISPECIES: SDR family NAD(P)-dependent oxidoreductase [unclassified Pseudomonas]|uniref:SDR family NAD(P)-dependent oxidoreductase n=1 Tax=unclassified Pseudomonas TaxID=196821 RepID=UPI0030DB9854